MNVGTLSREPCTPPTGERDVLRTLPEDRRVGVGAVNRKQCGVSSVDEMVAKPDAAIRVFGAGRVSATTDSRG